MRALPDGLQNHLDGGVTTLCHCWRLRLRSGDVLGFTDHDRDVVYDGVTHEAAAGFTASEMESAVGFAVDNMTAAGALSSERLSAARLQAGDFDHAQIEVWRVNWQQVNQRFRSTPRKKSWWVSTRMEDGNCVRKESLCRSTFMTSPKQSRAKRFLMESMIWPKMKLGSVLA